MRADELTASILTMGRIQCGPEWSLTGSRTRQWTDLDLWFLVQGHGEMKTAGLLYTLRPGSCLIMRGGEDYEFRQSPQDPFRHYWVHFEYDGARGPHGFRKLAALPPLFRQAESWSPIEHMLERAVQCWRGPASDKARAQRWFMSVLMEIAVQDERHLAPMRRTLAWADQIADLCRQISLAPAHAPGVEEMADKLALSRGHFCRLFARQTGMPPRQFILNCRLSLARDLLRNSTCSISEIAAQTGYQDVFFFSRHFKQHEGMSPSAYRAYQPVRAALSKK